MGSAMSIGQTGLVASSKQLDVIAGNLANSNTVGFKSGNTLFSSLMNQGLNRSGTLGQGVEVSNVVTDFGQGSFEYTSSVTDMAIDGDGFFMVTDPNNVALYTRAGAFHIDNEDYLVDVRGYRVQGFVSSSGVVSSVPADIPLQRSKDATTTTEISFGANLDETTLEDGTYNISQTVYDSKGAAHILSIIFTKTADAGEWDWTTTFDGFENTTATGTVTFDANGAVDTPADEAIEINIADADILAALNGADIGDGGEINWALATDTTRMLTGYASASGVRSLHADGFAAGELRSLSIDSNGVISGVYTNGQTLELAQIGLASFREPTALTKNGNYFMESTSSGRPNINMAGTGGLGTIQSNSLEVSNTDVSKEFINMITAQRAYQASAKIITTADQMLTILMNIKQ